MNRLPVVVCGFAMLVFACSCHDEVVEVDGPNVVFFLVDTLRPDHLSVYGYDLETSDRLEEFAKDAVLFEEAYSPTSWTRPAVVSLLTGLTPLRHRVVNRAHALSPDLTLLSEHLKPYGYATAAAVTNPNVLASWGFGQGFDTYDDVDPSSRGAPSDVMIDHVEGLLEGLSSDRPFFLYVHVIDPHSPYSPPPPYDRMFSDGRERRVARYDGEIAFADFHFGRFVDRLKRDGLYDDSIIVFVSDHGEEFGERGGRDHGHTLYEESVRVPLLIKLAGSAHGGSRLPVPVSIIDVVPTILSLLGLPEIPGVEGRDLTPLLRDEASSLAERALYLDLELDWPNDHVEVVRGVRVGSLKYLDRLRPRPERRLFDVGEDPGETVDLRSADPDAAALMAGLLDAQRTDLEQGKVPAAEEIQVDEAVQERLRALGYLPASSSVGERSAPP